MRDDRAPGERLYGLLLHLHPLEFRRRHGRDMVELYRDGWWDRVRGRGIRAALGFWSGILVGTIRSAARQRFGGRRGDRWDESNRGPEAARRGITGTKGTGGDAMETWSQDLRYALRSLRARPGFTAVVVLTLTLGIGANTAVFSVLHAVLLAPLPYERAAQLVRIYESRTDAPTFRNYLAQAPSLDLRESLTTVAAFSVLYNYQQETADLTDGDRPEKVRVLPVSQGYFRVVGEEPMLGRTFRRAEERGSARVTVVSQRIFDSYLGGDPAAMGRSLTLDGAPFSVVGVMPEGYQDPLQGRIDVLVPVNLEETGGDAWGNHYLTCLVRLAEGATLADLRSELEVHATRHRDLGGEQQLAYAAVPLRDDLLGGADTTLWILMGAVGLVFLIACVNVAGVTLARGAARERELAIRSALGSSRMRLVRQLLTESLVLALAGGLAGLGLGWALVDTLVALAPGELPGLARASLSGPVFAFGLGASGLAVLLFGLLPALHASRTEVEGALREGGVRTTSGPGRTRLRSGLVVGEVALALVLLAGAGILVKSFQRLRALDLGIVPEDVVVFEVTTPGARYDAPARARFHESFLERLAGLPGVEATGAVSWLPLGGNYHNWGARRVLAGGELSEGIGTNQRVVEGDYFRALGIELLWGRTFGPQDGSDDPDRLVVNRRLVERLFPDGTDPLGQTVQVGPWPKEIIGVVEDVPTDARGGVRPILYHRHLQFADNRNWTLRYTVKLAGPLPDFLPRAREELAALDPDLVLYEPRLLGDVLGRGLASERFAMTLLSVFAGVALLLAGVGLYGVLAQTVSRRRHEIGIRIALGARGREVLHLVVRQGLGLALAGVVLGLGASLLLTRWLESLVYEVSLRDPAVLALVALGVLSAALLASWLPAARAVRVDPVEAFRAD